MYQILIRPYTLPILKHSCIVDYQRFLPAGGSNNKRKLFGAFKLVCTKIKCQEGSIFSDDHLPIPGTVSSTASVSWVPAKVEVPITSNITSEQTEQVNRYNKHNLFIKQIILQKQKHITEIARGHIHISCILSTEVIRVDRVTNSRM